MRMVTSSRGIPRRPSRKPISGHSADPCAHPTRTGFSSPLKARDLSAVTRRRLARLFAILPILILAACAVGPPPPPKLTLMPARFSDLPGWDDDQLGQALIAFVKSCGEIAQRNESAFIGLPGLHVTAADWRDACAGAAQASPDDASARAFFERYFTPYLAGNNGESEGLFTGYYEPLLHGTRERGGVYQTPILKRPPDLVMVELGRFRPSWHGERIGGRVVDGS